MNVHSDHLDRIPHQGSCVFIMARVASELDEIRFFDWVWSLVEPLHGDVVQAGVCAPKLYLVTTRAAG